MVRRTFKDKLRDWLYPLKRAIPREFSLRYKHNFHPEHQASQGGEDGINHEIFRRIGVDKGTFVEFGAWNGVRYANSFALLRRGWSGLYIEADPEKFKELVENMKPYPGVECQCRFVRTEGEDSLDQILQGTQLPKDFDFLCIDIDSVDYWIWKSVEVYRPKVVVMEYNPHYAPHESMTLPPDARPWEELGAEGYGASAAALTRLGKAKGYTLVAYTRKLNLFFVRDDLAKGRFDTLDVTRVPYIENSTVSKSEWGIVEV